MAGSGTDENQELCSSLFSGCKALHLEESPEWQEGGATFCSKSNIVRAHFEGALSDAANVGVSCLRS